MSGSMSSDRVGSVEVRGIEPVPESERHGHAGQMYWTWLAANLSLLGLPLGAALVAFRSLNFWQAAVTAVIGAVGSFALVGALSIAGKRGGAPALTLSRAVFGVRGNIGPALLAWLSRAGWEVITTTTAAYVLLSLLSVFGVRQNTVLTLLCLLVFLAFTLLLSGLGHATIMWFNRWATCVFGVLNLVVVGFLAATADWAEAMRAPMAPSSAVVAGVGIIAAGTGIGWAGAGADYARYLPSRIPGGRLVVASVFGAGIPLVLLICLGALLTAGDPSLAAASDPVAAINAMLPSWMSVPYLIAAFGGLLLSNHLSTYSAGLTLLALGVRARRSAAVGIDVVICFMGGIYFMLVARDFYGPFITLLTLLAVPVSAWAGVFAVDLVHRSYVSGELTNTRPGGRYWYKGGFAWSACVAWVAATVTGVLLSEARTSDSDVWFSGPCSHSWLGANGLGWFVAFIVAAASYLLLRPLDRAVSAEFASCLAASAAASPGPGRKDGAPGAGPHLVLAGSVIVDVTLPVPHLPEQGGDVIASDTLVTAGGGFNVMSAAHRLGLPTLYGGAHGTGPFGDKIREALAAEDIGTILAPHHRSDSGFCVAFVDADGERTFATGFGAEKTLTASDMAYIIVRLQPGDFVQLSGYSFLHEQSATALYELAATLPGGVQLCFDPGPLVADIPETVVTRLLKHCDWLSCNLREARVLTHQPDAGTAALKLLDRVRGGVIVRKDAAGCWVGLPGDGVHHVPVRPVVAVDSHGAGDTHVGAFLALLSMGASPLEAARGANVAASVSVTRRGPATGPTAEELINVLGDDPLSALLRSGPLLPPRAGTG